MNTPTEAPKAPAKKVKPEAAASESTRPSPKVDEGLIADYLRTSPDFFSRHADLVSELYIPHESGRNLSLLEYQVRRLREETSDMRNKYLELLRDVRQQETLLQSLQDFSVSLMHASSLQRSLSVIEAFFKEDLGVDGWSLHLFDLNLSNDDFGDEWPLYALRDDDNVHQRLEDIAQNEKGVRFHRGRPGFKGVSSELADTGLQSFAEIVLDIGEPLGLLTLGSRDPDALGSNDGETGIEITRMIGRLIAARLAELADRGP